MRRAIIAEIGENAEIAGFRVSLTAVTPRPGAIIAIAYNPPVRRALSLAGSVLFVFYCTAVGVYLLLRPWSPSARAAAGISASGFFRGFVSGLGLLHLVVGIADLRVLSRALDPPAPDPDKP
ncbi:MAG TPA: hypothetical protein VEO37_11360 [Thermoanaerobaculia bacterium]|nr:hypothetical protein [Thermoanaerobaculia bacterium]